ncbi:hypothetical protein [Desulfonatronovibrio magnus]|uniref:hypothetical protein n=1 Tax=Desulfonatronovibrio magnus TaxID=698827 RepID=UPI0005EB7FFC|nr:hypothetical protein [Desulfonatronovibrio magnus]
MTTRTSLSGLNHKSCQHLRDEIQQTANSNIETMEEYTRLIRLVRTGFSRKHKLYPDKNKEE